jgi:geranylgeranyl reductase family protein
MQYKEVAVAGGGPAGAFCAYNLAREGINATVFDHTHPREKPCGGAILPSVLEKFPFVDQFRSKSGSLADLRIITPKNREATTNRFEKGFTISRRIFDEGIMNMATENGAELIKEKIMSVSKKKEQWKIKTSKRTLYANTIVGAEGVNSKVRYETVGSFPKKDLAITFGCITKGIEKEKPIIKFLTGINGYIWSFHRNDHSSIGIGSELNQRKKLKQLLGEFIHSYYPKIRIVTRFTAMLPSARSPEFFKKPCAGKDWILVGDAAGHVDPISRDGILYALWSGKLAAKAIEKNNPESYETQWRNQYGNYLEKRREHRDNFYNPFALEMSIMGKFLH